jgi:hypothetical protein
MDQVILFGTRTDVSAREDRITLSTVKSLNMKENDNYKEVFMAAYLKKNNFMLKVTVIH